MRQHDLGTGPEYRFEDIPEFLECEHLPVDQVADVEFGHVVDAAVGLDPDLLKTDVLCANVLELVVQRQAACTDKNDGDLRYVCGDAGRKPGVLGGASAGPATEEAGDAVSYSGKGGRNPREESLFVVFFLLRGGSLLFGRSLVIIPAKVLECVVAGLEFGIELPLDEEEGSDAFLNGNALHVLPICGDVGFVNSDGDLSGQDIPADERADQHQILVRLNGGCIVFGSRSLDFCSACTAESRIGGQQGAAGRAFRGFRDGFHFCSAVGAKLGRVLRGFVIAFRASFHSGVLQKGVIFVSVFRMSSVLGFL